MRHVSRRVWVGLAATLLVVGLPLAGHWLRRGGTPRCAFAGLRIDPLYRVRVVDATGESHSFCCIRCAAAWLRHGGIEPAAVYVTDEATGAEVEASGAYFVESPVVTNRVTGNRFHAFRDRVDAEAHTATFGGVILVGTERPLRAAGVAPGSDPKR